MDNRVVAVRLVSSQQAGESGVRDRILIKDLVLPARIGVHMHEKGATQRVRINVELDVASRSEALDDDISQVVSYEHIVTGIKSLIAGGHINLVETLAERIAEICLADARAPKSGSRNSTSNRMLPQLASKSNGSDKISGPRQPIRTGRKARSHCVYARAHEAHIRNRNSNARIG